MKIKKVEPFVVGNPWKSWVFVRITTNDGYTGVAESTLNGFALSVVHALKELSPYFIGKDPHDIERISNDMFTPIFSRGGMIHKSAIAAIDVACWDIIAKHANVPLWQLLGGRFRNKLLCYANGWYRHERTPEEFSNSAKKVVEMGYKALKFDPFGDAWGEVTIKEIYESIEIIAAVRDTVGNDVEILIEGHGRFTVGSAIRISKAIEPYDPMLFEEPVAPENIAGLIEVSKHSRVPIAAGERIYNLELWADLFSKGALQFAQPDIINSGGISHAKKVAAIAEAYGISVAPHNPQGPISTAICTNFGISTSNFAIQEIFDDFNEPWTKDLITNPFEVVDGFLYPSNKPGLGVEIVDEVVNKHLSDGSESLNLFVKGWEKREKN
ncbi:MAG: mandelate racemase/muconate lactonizing enzyme family protein [Bacteroidales bacterium]|nr:mandelate racemase/muconate lactonizing enzyme family protein [Bacteroidales bacterium]